MSNPFFKCRPVYDLSTLELPVDYNKLGPEQRYELRQEYTHRQSGMCYYCHSPLHNPPPADVMEKQITPHLYPDGFFTRPEHLHHDHDTGMTIGAVHARCNAILWEYENE